MKSPTAADRLAAESWFLYHGLPAVLPKRARWSGLWRRSAPVIVGWALIVIAGAVTTYVAGGSTVDIQGVPTTAQWVALAALGCSIPLAFVIGYVVSRITDGARRRTLAIGAVGAAIVADFFAGGLDEVIGNLIGSAFFVGTIMVCTGLGIGSVLGWAVRLTGSHLASAGHLVSRALPVVLLTVLVFFNGFVWSMATKVSAGRMFLVLSFLVVIAVAFLFSGLRDRVKPMLADSTHRDTDEALLADTPFADTPDPETSDPLTRGERTNVMFVVATSQITQVAMVALSTCAIFFALGLVALSPDLLAEWTKNAARPATLLNIELPVPMQLIRVTLFLGALTFMYVSARAVGDGEYRTEFLDPLIDDLRVTLVARDRYRSEMRVA